MYIVTGDYYMPYEGSSHTVIGVYEHIFMAREAVRTYIAKEESNIELVNGLPEVTLSADGKQETYTYYSNYDMGEVNIEEIELNTYLC